MSLFPDLAFFERAAFTLLRGGKLFEETESSGYIQALLKILMEMHRSHLIAAEPQSYVRLKKNHEKDPTGQFMGLTHIHPVSTALHQAAEHLKSICVLKKTPVADFEVLGLNWQKRRSGLQTGDFQTDKVAVLTTGDIVSLWQAMSLIRQREGGTQGSPIIIQNTNRFWNPLLAPLFKSKGHDALKKLEDIGVYITRGTPETADLLASFEKLPKVDPGQIALSLAEEVAIEDPVYVFATTDQKKFDEIAHALRFSGKSGHIRKAIDVLGKSEIPLEETHSYEGNAAEKMEALIARVKDLGIEEVKKLLNHHGIHDMSRVILMTNDGGLGACLENDDGKRYIDLFTPEFFEQSYQRLNPIQMSPGVELAYLMKATGLETAFDQMQRSVKAIVRRTKGKFRRQDLRAYDTSLQMTLPLSRVIEAIHDNASLDLQSLGAIAVFNGQRLKLSSIPKGPRGAKVETVNYLMVPDRNEVRAENLDWVKKGPNAQSFYLMQRYAGTDRYGRREDHVDLSAGQPIKMGLLATPSLLFARAASPALTALKRTLKHDFDICSQHRGNKDWQRFKDDMDAILEQAEVSRSNSAYRAGVRQLLDKCSVTDGRPSVFYVGEMKSKKILPQILQGLSFFSAVVRNQVFNPVNLVVNRASVPHLMGLIEHKQKLGLIGQSTEHVMTVIESEADAAAAIAKLVKTKGRKITPIERKFTTDGQVENKDCMVVTTYFSASNLNDSLVKEAQRLGYLLAVNGFSLKVGGGNDGLMKAVSDGFMSGKRELEEKGYNFPNQLILIQCVDTESIERAYDAGGIARCHPTIEAREADLQNTDFVVAGAGGAGTDEEIFAELYSRISGLSDSAKKPLILFNQQVMTSDGVMGVHDPYKDMFDDNFRKSMNMDFILSPEEIVARASLHRETLRKKEQVIAIGRLREAMRDQHRAEKRFLPPFRSYTGAEKDLPKAVHDSCVHNRTFPQVA